jgi:hypothetical protein
MRRSHDERIRLTALVLIVGVLVVKLSLNATGGHLALDAYAFVNLGLVIFVTGIVAVAVLSLPAPKRTVLGRRLRITARKRRSRGHTIHLN